MFIRARIHGTKPPKRRGVVLLAVLVVVTLLTLAAYQYGNMMLSEYKAADANRRAAMARAAAKSGIDYALAVLSNSDYVQNTLNGNPWDNTSAFQGVVVHDSDQPRFKTMFSLIGPLDVDATSGGVADANQGFRYGVVDESAKLNLQSLMQIDPSGQIAKTALMKIPNMTDDASDSMLDWIDPRSSQPRTSGAKDMYYSTLSPPYHVKNGPLDSLEELLLVKGVTPQLLFGIDRNRNGLLDPEENDGTGVLDRGWSQYLTVYTRELNVDSTGTPRIYLNDSDLQTLYTNLETAVGADLPAYIIAYRQYGSGSGAASPTGGQPTGAAAGNMANRQGGATGAQGGTPVVTGQTVTPTGRVTTTVTAGAGGGTAAGGAGAARSAGGTTNRLTRGNLNFQGGGQANSISSLYSLINSSVSIPATDANGQPVQNGTPTVYPSPMSDASSIRQLFPTLYDKTTTQTNGEFPGRVNVNTGTQAVLSSLPGFSDSDVQAIIAHRPDPSSTTAPDPIFQTPAWLLTEANISPNTLQTVDRYITARTQVYRVQSVGYFEGGGPTARIEAVIDTNGGRPRILYWRDLTELGKGYDLGQ